MKYHLRLQPGTFYHIFSRATGNEKLFKNDENYRFFLNKFKMYIHPLADVYAYCLLPNHFHFLIKVKDEEDIIGYSDGKGGQKSITEYIMQAFSNFLNSYAKFLTKFLIEKGACLLTISAG